MSHFTNRVTSNNCTGSGVSLYNKILCQNFYLKSQIVRFFLSFFI